MKKRLSINGEGGYNAPINTQTRGDKIRIILDTNVLYSALRGAGKKAFLLETVIQKQHRLIGCVSVALLLENEEILKNKRQDINKGRRKSELEELTEQDIDDILDFYATQCLQFAIPLHTRPVLTDPDDEFIVDLAAISRAAICTDNVKDFKLAIVPYRIRVITPAALFEMVKNETT